MQLIKSFGKFTGYNVCEDVPNPCLGVVNTTCSSIDGAFNCSCSQFYFSIGTFPGAANEQICLMNQSYRSQLTSCASSYCGPNAICSEGENFPICKCPVKYPAGNPYNTTGGCSFVNPSIVLLISIPIR